MAKLRKTDYGRKMVDEQLDNLEARLTSMYAKAANEITERMDNFLDRFKEQDKVYREAVRNGDMTRQDYKDWQVRQILRSDRMQAQINSLTETMVHADEVAAQMINGELPSVYANSYNFAGYRGEKYAEAAGYDYHTFNIYNSDAIRLIQQKDPDLIPALKAEKQVDIPVDERWNRQHIQSAIAQGIVQGDSVDQIAKRLQAVAEMDDNTAIRNARTAFTAVENEARRDATERIKEAGIPMVEKWIATLDARTRETHLLMDGTEPNEEGLFGEGIITEGDLLRFPGDPNGAPSEIYNCRCGVTSSLPNIDHSKDMELYEQFMQKNYYEDWLEHKQKEQNPETYVGARKLEQEYALQRQAELRGEAPEQPTGAHTYEKAKEVLTEELGFRYVDENMISNLDEEFFAEQVNRIDELNAKYGAIHPEDNLGAVIPVTPDQREAGVVACVNRPVIGEDRADIQSICFNNSPSENSYGYDNRERHIDMVREEVEVTGYSMPCAEENYGIYNITHEYGHVLEARIISDFENNPEEMLDLMFQNTRGEIDTIRDLVYDSDKSYLDMFTEKVFHDGEWDTVGEDMLRNCIMSEIQSIVMENYDVTLDDIENFYTSAYGRASSSEFFAEAFANANCGDVNIIGEAINEWLGRLGYSTNE